ncbi:hypothetical protein CkaCkLH20_09439 [Colletotrichum karsti]|uniref:Store-operated calcium entry-associated regulatory factor n=1 Tax=Colletotrichum karsti TaxID=1095194 RepID=A0A9P6HYJ2_9PEZI|nr:uncharacterized protein CkaCkLH20_09439 [Colletotrichum karsti]KAF9872929.1 hypothetical protein CkaCkLH20_09439 [Colletotrichum karsti]
MHLTLPLTLTLLPFTTAAKAPKNAILLSDVKSLTLRGHGALTTHRRVPAAPQLKCVSRKALCDLVADDIDVMRCTNQGSGYAPDDVQWSCVASLPEELKLGSTDVVCEGYDSRDDPYVLRGSCGVEYRLALTDKGERRYPDLGRGGGGGDGGTDLGGVLFAILFFAVLGWIVYSACVAGAENRRAGGPRRRGGGGGGGGYGGGGGGGGWNPGFGPDNNDPPPPYPGTKPSGSQSGGQQGWRPGFWTGAAAAGAAGYGAGLYQGRNNNRNQGYGSGWGNDSSSNWGAGPSRSSSSSSSARQESTGFGSTSRR